MLTHSEMWSSNEGPATGESIAPESSFQVLLSGAQEKNEEQDKKTEECQLWWHGYKVGAWE